MPGAVFRRFRNYVSSRIRFAKKVYYQRKFAECSDNLKMTWKLINDVIRPSHSHKKRDIVRIVDGDIEYCEPLEIAEKFNNIFSSAGRVIAESCPDVQSNFSSWLTGNFLYSFVFAPLTSQVARNIVLSLKSITCSVSQMPVFVFKYISEIISPVLCVVIPLFKGGEHTNPSNYRPISILSTFSKVFEKAVHVQLYNYFERNKTIFSGQFGFRKSKSTLQSCVGMQQYLCDNLDAGNNVLSIFLDFSKAFDSVDHGILLHKLRYYGVRGFMFDRLK